MKLSTNSKFSGLIFLIFFYSITWSQSNKHFDFERVDAFLELDTLQKSIFGKVNYHFEVLQATDTLTIDAHNMSFYEVKLNGGVIPFVNNKKALQLIMPFEKGKYNLSFNYHAVPNQALYFIGWKSNSPKECASQIWSQGQGKYTSHWFPSFDDVQEKLIFNLDIKFNSSYQVISNGLLKGQISKGDKTLWQYRMNEPMSSYLLALVVGKFEKQNTVSQNNIPLEFYYEAEDSAKKEYTYKYATEIFNFLENEIDVKFPWEIYRNIPVRDFLYAGMENTTSTIFSKEFVIDKKAFNDQNYINVYAHELAHQWFGNLVTAESSTHHWLQEGFATYYALLAEKEVLGNDHFQWELFKNAVELQEATKDDSVLLSEKASSLTYYKKGAWALHFLRTQIGEQKFKKAVKNYLEKGKYLTVNTNDFLNEIKKVSKINIKEFSKIWLEGSVFPSNEAFSILSKNKFIEEYLAVQNLRNKSIESKSDNFKKIITSNAYYPIKEEVVYQIQMANYPENKDLILLILQQNNPKLDLALSYTTKTIPDEIRTNYERLLDSDSYRAQEIAGFKLWRQYPEHSVRYLDYTKGRQGFYNKNLELQWLYMAIVTRGYHSINLGEEVYKLLQYTNADYDADIREIAMQYCLEIELINKQLLRNLIQATTHHKWQFSKFARKTLLDILKDVQAREAVAQMMDDLNVKEIAQIQRIYEQMNQSPTKVE